MIRINSTSYKNIKYHSMSHQDVNISDLRKELKYKINIDYARDDLLTVFGKAVVNDRYLLKGERVQDMFARVASYYADDAEHAQRLYDYMSKLWFMPATPVLTNGGTKRGLPISCFLNEVSDNLNGIVKTWEENVWLAANGGGIGTYWGNLRSIGEEVRGGQTSGIIPFIRVQDSVTLAISQGNLRRGSAAVYLDIHHPEIEEFIEIRRPTGGDPNRKALNIHHGVVVSDAFMRAVENDDEWNLISPKTKEVRATVGARDLWIKLLTTRMETGEPYILFSDAVNDLRPEIYKKLGLSVQTSNLCSEITLTTGKDHMNKERTAVCCLSSVNLEKYEEWEKDEGFISDIMRFLDNLMEDFIQNASEHHHSGVYSASRERSVGLGVMGFHSFLQSKSIPMESVVAKSWNNRMFSHIKKNADRASIEIAERKGACPDAVEANINERFVHKMAIAPTASISIIAGGASPGIEPYAANSFTHKTLSGSFNVKNRFLKAVLQKYGQDTQETWSSIMNHEGSVQHLDYLTQRERDVFKTAFEIDQRWIVDLCADRTPMICQAQSLNIFLHANIHKRELHEIHMRGWKKGLKSFYYLRSKSLQRADKVSHAVVHQLEMPLVENEEDECLACQ